jgi:hypothetical protein
MPPPLTHCIRVYSILIHTGKGGIVEPERRLEGQQFTKLGRNTNITDYLQSINSDTPAAKSLYRSVFLDDDILLWCTVYIVN